MPRSPTGAHGSCGDSNSTAARSASVTPSTSGPSPNIARRSLTNLGFRNLPLTAGSGNADNERPRRRRRLGLGAARIPWFSPLSIGVPMPLTQAEMDFFTRHAYELHNFDRPTPAHDFLRSLCTTGRPDWRTMSTFQYLWQEQSRYDGTAD